MTVIFTWRSISAMLAARPCWLESSYVPKRCAVPNTQPTVKRQATTVVHMPLPYDKEKKLWKVTGWYLESSEETGEVMQSKQIAFSVFKSFYESGNLKSIYHYNAQNKRDGKAETYFDEKDKIAETLTFNKNTAI